MSSDVSASSSSSHQSYKLYRGGTIETVRHRHYGEKPSTSHLIYGDIRGGEESLNGASPQCPIFTGVGESDHSLSVGRAHPTVPPGADTGMSGMDVLPDQKRTRSNLTGANGRGEGRTKTSRRDNTRAPGICSNVSRLDVDVDGNGRSSSGRLAGGKEPPIQGLGGLTMATLLKLVTILAALCSAGVVWLQYDSARGKICPKGRNKPCLDNPISMALLTIAKMCAGALFPSIIVSVLSKCYTTRHFLNNSWLSLVVNFEPTHKLHICYGVVTIICSVAHSLAHIASMVYDSNPELLHMSTMKRSGVVALVLLLLTALPMVLGFLKSKWTFELRKLMHLAFIPFVIAVCFHGARLRLMGAILLTWYLVDRFYFTTRMTFLINRPNYKIVGRGTLVRFNLPDGYHFKSGAYVQVNCPAISASEWHPFSLFPVPGSKPRAGFHVEAVGDWTKELFRLSLENPHMPLWITAAQPSVLEQSIYYDNVILVCTGTGITPGVCLIERFASRKNIHLLWLSREAGLVAMFEKQIRLVKSTIYLTGNPSFETKQRLVDLLAPSKSEVVATTAAASHARSGSHTTAPSSSDLSVLEAADHRAVNLKDYPGALRDEDDHNGRNPKEENDSESDGRWRRGERSSFGAAVSPVKGRPIPGREPPRKSSRDSDSDDVERDEGNRLRGSAGNQFSGRGSRAQSERKLRAKRVGARRSLNHGRSHNRTHSGSQSPSHSHSHRQNHNFRGGRRWHGNGGGKRSRGLHPVSVCFGRPNIEQYIMETVEGTAVMAEWADQAVSPTRKSSPSPSRQRQALVRLNTNQRISKRDLMSADLSVVADKSSPVSNNPDGVSASGTVVTGQSGRQTDVNGKWLVLYCGGNVAVEKALAIACSKRKITWRKEYFSAW